MGIGEIADIGNIGMGLAEKGASLANTIDSIYMRHKNFKENKRQFDAQFNESVRQFGLDYALKDYATRAGISLQKAQQLYNAQNLTMAQTAQTENLKTSALGRDMQSTEFKWAQEDRAKKQGIGKAMQKGLVMGLTGGK